MPTENSDNHYIKINLKKNLNRKGIEIKDDK